MLCQYLLYSKVIQLYIYCCCCSVTKSCWTFCNPMDCSRPGSSVLHHLLEFAQTPVHRVNDTITISSSAALFSSCPQSFPASGSFPKSQLFASDGIFFFFSMMVYYMIVNITIVSYAININQFASANPKLPVLPSPSPPHPLATTSLFSMSESVSAS